MLLVVNISCPACCIYCRKRTKKKVTILRSHGRRSNSVQGQPSFGSLPLPFPSELDLSLLPESWLVPRLPDTSARMLHDY